MADSYQGQLWQMMIEKAKDVSAFIAVSQYFADVMKKKMNIPEQKLYTLHIGVDPSNYIFNEPAINNPTIGYLSRLNKENGLEILIDAFILLKENDAFKNVRLRLSGGKTNDDQKFINTQISKLKKKNYENDVDFREDFSTNISTDFFDGLSVLSVPVEKGEAFGLFQLEALASGIPIIQPELGAFPEIVKISGGGKCYSPNSPTALAEKLKEVLSDSDLLITMGKKGRHSVEEYFNIDTFTEKMLEVYKGVVIDYS